MTTATTEFAFVVFAYPDSTGRIELWDTDGTAANTFEITPSTQANSVGVGVNPHYVEVLGNQILFDGVDSAARIELWTATSVDGGPPTSEQEITGINDANFSSPLGFDVRYLTAYSNVVLFVGRDTAGDNYSLWKTDGTAAGTVEIGGLGNAGIANASSSGLLPGNPDFTPFNNVLLFEGDDANGNMGLWQTNGTAAGTREITSVVDPQYMTVLGSEVIFNGSGGLWETDGTAAGTVEIGGAGNIGIDQPVGSTGLHQPSLNPYGIAANGLGGTFFAATSLKGPFSAAQHIGLWTSDGTVAGTFEIGYDHGAYDITDANPYGGIFGTLAGDGLTVQQTVQFPDFTRVGNVDLFVGLDSDGHIGLWRTDGTAAGTVEVGGLDNAGINGGLTLLGSQSPDFTPVPGFQGAVMFEGLDGSGHPQIFITDGSPQNTIPLSQSDGFPFKPDMIPPLPPGFLPIAPLIDGTMLCLLQRAPTSAELSSELAILNTGGVSAMVSSVVDSTEAQFNLYPVAQIIKLALGNFPTAAQMDGWVPFIEQNGLLTGQAQTNPLLDQMATAFVASDNFGKVYNNGVDVDPNSAVTAYEMQVIIQSATGVAATQNQINVWTSLGLTIDQVFVDFALGDQYTTASQAPIQQFLTTLVDTTLGITGSAAASASAVANHG